MTSRARHVLAVAIVIALAVLAHAPSLSWGFYADDYGQQLVLEGADDELRDDPNVRMRPWSLFDFGYAPTAGSPMQSQGFYPWWVSPDWKLRFFRPLSSATHWLDQTLFGRTAELHHAMTLVYFAALLALIYALYRAVGLTTRTALIALSIFGFDDSSLIVVGWLANRNALIEALFAVAAVLVALRTREKRLAAGAFASYALAFCACVSKESGIAAPVCVALIYLGAQRRALAAVGIAIAVGYLACLLAADFGSRAAFYPTPWFESAAWFRRAAQLFGFAPLAFAAPSPFDAAVFNPQLFWPWMAVSLALGALLWRAFWRARSTLPYGDFFAAWIVMTLLPQAGAPPSERLLFVPMVGAAPWIANFVERAFDPTPWRVRVAPTFVGGLAIVLSALVLVARGAFFADQVSKPLREAVLSAAATEPRNGPTTILVVQSPSAIAMLSPASLWVFETGDRTTRFAPLQWGRRALRWTTLDERTFELESLDEPFLDSLFEPVFLSSSAPIAPGTRWRASSFDVEAVEPAARGLRTIRVRLDAPLDDPLWRLVTWRDGRFAEFDPPAVGASVELERCEPIDPLMP